MVVGVRRETIVFLEKGKYNPSLKLAHDIAKVFSVGVEEVFVFEDDEKGGTGVGIGTNEKRRKKEMNVAERLVDLKEFAGYV